MSHGNRQKVALILAMAHRPDLLILDEPTQGLDPLMQQRFYEAIREARAHGTTVFVSSHNLVEVEHICDRVGMVRQGKLVSVEHIDVLKERRAHRMEITFAAPVPIEAFTGLTGVKDLSVEGAVLRCTIATVPDALIKAAGRFTVTDVISHEPSLEDIFLAMYGEAAAHVA
ncbi:MAG TPA: ABC transporter ATP-binding protein [Actinomycetota bacterium]|nr:ABC transporter ATP-binding protein [Actinomycetota bacterium]